MSDQMNHLTVKCLIKQSQYIVAMLYSVCLALNICQYVDLLKEYFTKQPEPEGAPYLSILSGEYANQYAPPVSEIVIRSVYIAAFLLLGVCVFSLLSHKIKRTAENMLSIAFIMIGAVVFCDFYTTGIILYSAVLVIHAVVLFLISAALLYIGVRRFKGSVRIISYAALIILTLVESFAFPFSPAAELWFLDAVVLSIIAILSTYENEMCVDEIEEV